MCIIKVREEVLPHSAWGKWQSQLFQPSPLQYKPRLFIHSGVETLSAGSSNQSMQYIGKLCNKNIMLKKPWNSGWNWGRSGGRVKWYSFFHEWMMVLSKVYMEDKNLFIIDDLIWLAIWGSSKGSDLRLDSLVGVGDGMKSKLGGGGGW